MSAIGPALSGIMAATTRLDVSAQNTANSRTPGYEPKSVVQTATSGGGVAVEKRPQQSGYFFADPFGPCRRMRRFTRPARMKLLICR